MAENEGVRDLITMIPRMARIEVATKQIQNDLSVIKNLEQVHSSDLSEIKARLAQLLTES